MNVVQQKAVFLIVALASAKAAFCASVKVTVQNLQSENGTLAYALFDQKKGFPEKKELSLKRDFIDLKLIKAHGDTFKIEGIKPGKYALTIYQDLNGNKKLDKNFLGIPKEPAGASNNPPGRLGPPRFRDCIFEVVENDDQHLTISMVN